MRSCPFKVFELCDFFVWLVTQIAGHTIFFLLGQFWTDRHIIPLYAEVCMSCRPITSRPLRGFFQNFTEVFLSVGATTGLIIRPIWLFLASWGHNNLELKIGQNSSMYRDNSKTVASVDFKFDILVFVGYFLNWLHFQTDPIIFGLFMAKKLVNFGVICYNL